MLRDAGFRLIVVTNQAGIARRFYDESTMDRLHEHLRRQLILQGVTLVAIYFCPYHPQGNVKELAVVCDCRKPSSGMLLQAAKDFDLNHVHSVFIGDMLSDLQAGRRAGVGRLVIIKSGHSI